MIGLRTCAAVLVALLASACGQQRANVYPGYIEAEFVRVGAPLGGTLAKLAVRRGDQVQANAPLFALESEQERAAREQAQAQLVQAQANLANLEKARRPPEIAAAQAQLAQAQAAQAQSEADYVRTQKLVADKFLPPQQLDAAIANRNRDRARVAELSAQVQLAHMPARTDEIAASRAQMKAANDALAQAQWRLDQKTQTAPAAGLVFDTLYREGEWVSAGAPVVSLLPPGNVKVRFYVPEPMLAAIAPGQIVRVHCDGCASDVDARVSFIAPNAEYTPPVIYSRENRAKLVFLIEARPTTPVPFLRPGLPVEVSLRSQTR